ncbi:hypothetical protein IWW54_006782, partial [Coemansia sp. RSA 2705]
RGYSRANHTCRPVPCARTGVCSVAQRPERHLQLKSSQQRSKPAGAFLRGRTAAGVYRSNRVHRRGVCG